MTLIEPLLFSIRTFLKNPGRALGLSLLGYGWFMIDPAIQIALKDRDGIGWIPKFWLVGLFAVGGAMIALINYFSKRYQGADSTLRDDLASVRGAYWSAHFYGIAYAALVLLSALAFVLPAIWTATVLSLAFVGSVIHREPGRSPFATSRALAAGHFAPLFVVFVFAMLPYFAGFVGDRLPFPMQARAIAGSALTALFMPLIVGAQVGAYHKLWDLKVAESGNPPPAVGSRIGGLTAFFAAVGTVAAMGVATVAVSLVLRYAARSPQAAEIFSRFSEPERAILGTGIEFDVPTGWRVRQSHPHQFMVWNPANKFIRSLTVTGSDSTYFPKYFQDREMDAAFIKEYVTDVVLRPRTGEPKENLLTEETLTAAGRQWTVLSYQSSERQPRKWVYWVTADKGRLISVTAAHPAGVSDTVALANEVRAVKDWLATMKDLGQITFWQRSDELEPMIRPGDRLFVKAYGPGESPQKGDLIVYHVRQNKNERYALRVAGLPDEVITLRDGTTAGPRPGYYLLADNPFTDQYNRAIGPVDPPRVLGYLTEIYAPRKRARLIEGRPGPQADPLADKKRL